MQIKVTKAESEAKAAGRIEAGLGKLFTDHMLTVHMGAAVIKTT